LLCFVQFLGLIVSTGTLLALSLTGIDFGSIRFGVPNFGQRPTQEELDQLREAERIQEIEQNKAIMLQLIEQASARIEDYETTTIRLNSLIQDARNNPNYNQSTFKVYEAGIEGVESSYALIFELPKEEEGQITPITVPELVSEINSFLGNTYEFGRNSQTNDLMLVPYKDGYQISQQEQELIASLLQQRTNLHEIQQIYENINFEDYYQEIETLREPLDPFHVTVLRNVENIVTDPSSAIILLFILSGILYKEERRKWILRSPLLLITIPYGIIKSIGGLIKKNKGDN
jgi:hypothetical protein